jgi:methionyl aminopeptidase
LVLHYANNEGGILKPGMIFTIEPILLQGEQGMFKWSDDWTVVSVDGGRSAQFEDTVLVTENGVEILTR